MESYTYEIFSDAEKLVTLGIGFTPSFSISIMMGTATAVNTIVSSFLRFCFLPSGSRTPVRGMQRLSSYHDP